jgi:hypothetical protein
MFTVPNNFALSFGTTGSLCIDRGEKDSRKGVSNGKGGRGTSCIFLHTRMNGVGLYLTRVLQSPGVSLIPAAAPGWMLGFKFHSPRLCFTVTTSDSFQRPIFTNFFLDLEKVVENDIRA